MNRPLRVLSLQPYFGGSHQQFHNGWVDKSAHQWTTLTLPPRHWKWRMRHASIHFAQQLQALVAEDRSWDLIVCTDMLNVAEFKGLIGPDLAAVPIVVYFHENQFAYPNRVGFKRDEHFPFTNFTSALAANKIWFNSRFNFHSMLEGLDRQAGRWPDYQPFQSIASLESKMEVQFPGIDTPPIDVELFLQNRIKRAVNSEPMHIVWAARWEHDKNAEDLFAALNMVAQKSIPFKLSVLGQSFGNSPPVFEQIRDTFSDQIQRWGFQETRQQYWEALAEADVYVSIAKHEFFGLSTAEAITAGLHPLVPNRLAYPELLSLAADKEHIETYLYDGTAAGLADSLSSFYERRAEGESNFNLKMANKLSEVISWKRRAVEMDQALAVIANTQ
jgi:glycosyltransferase involved in cell wall biosynthesis